MQRQHIIIALFFLLPFLSIGNGAPPWATLNEFYIDSTGAWFIELKFFQPQYVDSLVVESSTGSSKVASYSLLPGDLAVISDSNMQFPVSFNPEGDEIKVTSYGSGYYHQSWVIYGNFPNSFLMCAEPGDSYAYVDMPPSFGNGYALDQTPTLGQPNYYNGAVAEVSGMVYNLSGEPYPGGWFQFVLGDLIIDINPDGSYSKQLPARNYTCDQITIHGEINYCYNIEPVDFCIRPDSALEVDFVTVELVGTQEKEHPMEPLVIVSPNPFSSSVTFYWDQESIPGASIFDIEIYNSGGEMVFMKELEATSQQFNWRAGSHIPAGMYIYRISSENREIISGKIIKN